MPRLWITENRGLNYVKSVLSTGIEFIKKSRAHDNRAKACRPTGFCCHLGITHSIPGFFSKPTIYIVYLIRNARDPKKALEGKKNSNN